MNEIIANLTNEFPWYLLRWELSTLVLAPVIAFGARKKWNSWTCAILANAIGASIFYWVDKYLIFTRRG